MSNRECRMKREIWDKTAWQNHSIINSTQKALEFIMKYLGLLHADKPTHHFYCVAFGANNPKTREYQN